MVGYTQAAISCIIVERFTMDGIKIMKKCDLSPALFAVPYRGGVKFVAPRETNHPPLLTLADLLNLPVGTFFLDTESKILLLNDSNLQICGVESLKDIHGKTAAHFLKNRDDFHQMHSHDQSVLKQQQFHIVDEEVLRADDISFVSLAFKLPWYNADNKLIGIFGFSTISQGAGSEHISQNLTSILQTQLIQPNQPVLQKYRVSQAIKIFTQREEEVAKLCLRGKTSKEIARILAISNRTVEHHLINLKTKLNVQNKSELIEALFERYCL